MQVPLQITFREMDPSDAVEKAIREKAEKLEEFHGRLTSCHVVVETPHRHHHKGRVHHVKIHLAMPGHDITIDREPELGAHEDIYVAIRDAFDASVRQLRDYLKKQGQARHHE
jgi:ribosomal subunit interface protein